MKKLLFHPKPFDNECLSGYLIRVSDGLYPLQYSLSELTNKRINSYNIDMRHLSDENISYLANLCNIEITKLQNMRFEKSDDITGCYLYKGMLIDELSLSTKKAKVCPYCLSTSEYFRDYWYHINVTACPDHQTLLIDRCQKCNEEISWWKGNIFRCICGFEHKKAMSEAAPNASLRLSKFVAQRMGSNEDKVSVFDKPFNDILLHEFDDIFFLLASITNGVKRQQFTGKQFPVSKFIQFQQKLMEVLDEWPKGFHNFLDEYKKNKKESKFTNILGDFGRLYIQIQRDRKGGLQLLYKEFINYLGKNPTDYIGSTNITRVLNKFDEKYLTSGAASKHLGVGKETWFRLIDLGIVEGHSLEECRSKRVLVTKENLNYFKLNKQRLMTFNEVQSFLGIGERIVDELIELGFLTKELEEHSRSTKRLFVREDVHSFLAKLEEKIITPSAISSERITFSQVINLDKKTKVFSACKMVKLILEDILIPRWKGEGIGFNSLLFDKAEMRFYLKEQNNAVLNGYLTTNDVSRILKVKASCINFWVRTGILESSKLFGASYGKLFFPSDVESFNSKYVTIRELQLENTSQTKISAKKLMNNGLCPVTGSTIDGGLTYLFIRADVKQYLTHIFRNQTD